MPPENEPAKPTIGRVVWYCTDDEPWETFPAMVTDVPVAEETIVGLTVFTKEGPQYIGDVQYSETAAAGTWRWPTIS